MSDLIDESIRQNLINATYIHSNTDNFMDINLKHFQLKRTKETQRQLEDARNMLYNQIEKITELCNSFYELLSIPRRDNFNKRTGQVSYAGANYFSTHYLSKNNMSSVQASDNVMTKVISVMNTPSFEAEFYRNYNKAITVDSARFIKDWNDLAEKKGEDQQKIKTISENIKDITVNQLEEYLSLLFQRKQVRKNAWGTRVVADSVKKGTIKNGKETSGLFGTSAIQNLVQDALKNTPGAEALKKALIKKYTINQLETENIVDILWKSLNACAPQEIKNSINENEFKTYFYNAVSRNINKNATTFDDFYKFRGFLLEETFSFGFDQHFLKGILKDASIEVNGQNLEQKTLSNSMGGNKIINGQSGTDITIKIGNKVYRIQAKNSFSESMWLPIRLQGKIKVQTYAETVLSKEDAAELEYLIFNKAYLSQQGVDKQGNKHVYEKQDTMNNYINFFLYETLAYLVAGKIKQNSVDDYNGNLFFIFKGKYLMPVSVFLLSAYNLILQLLNSNTDINSLKSFGSLIYSQKLTGFKPTRKEATAFRDKKLDTLKNYWDIRYQADRYINATRKYPDSLINVGSEMGYKYKQQASFERLSFKVAIEEIDKILRGVR